MKYLINMVHHESKLGWFQNDWEQLRLFLDSHHLHGVEIIFYHDYNIDQIPKDLVHGMHLLYWPTWLDFWKGNQQKLEEQFLTKDNITMFYGSLERKSMVESLQKEFEVAQSLHSEYMVYHVSHVEVEHTYTWDFTYSDQEILDASVEMINEIYGDVDKGVTLLFENLWWPGLSFLNPQLTKSFFERIKYPNKGFVLDIGHLMITNKNLRTMDEACNYIEDILRVNPFLVENIVTIHLNKSLTGDYLCEDHEEKRKKACQCENFWDSLTETRKHIANIDTHVPFDHKRIKNIIQKVNPKYIVYEVLPESLVELTKMIELQNKVLDRD